MDLYFDKYAARSAAEKFLGFFSEIFDSKLHPVRNYHTLGFGTPFEITTPLVLAKIFMRHGSFELYPLMFKKINNLTPIHHTGFAIRAFKCIVFFNFFSSRWNFLRIIVKFFVIGFVCILGWWQCWWYCWYGCWFIWFFCWSYMCCISYWKSRITRFIVFIIFTYKRLENQSGYWKYICDPFCVSTNNGDTEHLLENAFLFLSIYF